jgi:hypothetical protein
MLFIRPATRSCPCRLRSHLVIIISSTLMYQHPTTTMPLIIKTNRPIAIRPRVVEVAVEERTDRIACSSRVIARRRAAALDGVALHLDTLMTELVVSKGQFNPMNRHKFRRLSSRLLNENCVVAWCAKLGYAARRRLCTKLVMCLVCLHCADHVDGRPSAYKKA